MTSIKPDETDMGLGWAHVRPQDGPHQPATILGNRKALELLRQAIDDALATRAKEGEAEVFARDGEGYRIRVVQVGPLDGLGWPWYADYRQPRPL